MTVKLGTTRRDRQAEQTRRDIVDAARALFAVHGYAGTSVAAIARSAGVSVQTIYDSIGSKSAILGLLNDRLDEEADVGPIAGRIPSLDDPVELLDVAVSISHNINERCADIAGVIFGNTAEPALAAVGTVGLGRHRDGCHRLAGRIASLGALRDGLDPEEAGDVIAAMCHPMLVRTFVFEYGWTWERWHTWTLDTLALLLLARPTAR
jgi:AcrR family transcriptional regulator